MRLIAADRRLAQVLGERAAERLGCGFSRERISRLIEKAFAELKTDRRRVRKTGANGPASPGATRLRWAATVRQRERPTMSFRSNRGGAAPDTLRKVVKSVFAQTYPHWELCICENGSSDPQTVKYLESLRAVDQRRRIRCLPKAAGPSIVVNAALETATGEFLTFTGLEMRADAFARHAAAVIANR